MFAVLATAGSNGWACNVPVFRYALERWLPDTYPVTVFHRGDLPAAQQEIVQALGQASTTVANLTIATVDVDKEIPEPLRALWESRKDAALPQLVVQYPVASRVDRVAWATSLTVEAARSLMDSPVRREIARRLLGGESAVWLLLESGTAADNDAAAKLLETELGKLENLLELPELTEADPQISSAVPLKVKFSVLHIKPDDPAERTFVRTLLSASDALEKIDRPVVFPVFGRGRALVALTSKALNAVSVQNAAGFMCGACSCEVKEMNPGLDLLIAADWDGGIRGRVVQDPPLPPLVSLSALAAATVNPATNPPAAPAPMPASSSLLARNVALAVAGGLIVIAGVTVLLNQRGKRKD